MEGKGPYRIYDPGGSDCQVKDEASSLSYRKLLEENAVLRDRMKGLKSLGNLLEESQTEAAKLRKKVEELVRDNEALKSSTTSFASSLCMGTPVQTDTQGHGKHHAYPTTERQESRDCLTGNHLQPETTESSSEFEVVNMEEKTASETQTAGVIHLPQENMELASQLRRLESSFSVFTEESNPNQLLAHLGRMAVEFHHLSSKVQKNEQRTSFLQTLCEQLRQENSELRKKMEDDLQYRNRDLEQLRQENLKLKEQVSGGAQAVPIEHPSPKAEPVKEETTKTKVEMTLTLFSMNFFISGDITIEFLSKIDNVQGEKECLTSETCELKQKVRYLQDQLLPLTKQREYQEKEIQRLNRVSKAHTAFHCIRAGTNLGLMHFVICVLITCNLFQVKIFEEDFRKERSDRERMNEEKEDLRRQVERLQGQLTNLTNQLHQAQNECQRERAERCKLERLQMQHKQGQQERRTSDPTSGSANGPMSPPYCGPFVQVGHQGLEGWPIHFPPRMPNISTAPGRDFQPVNPGFPWQSSFPQPRGSRGQADTARPPPETAGI
uniref:TNFAIP3 interacting protein 1 n=1 Tax=Cyprinus carpio TaxID=7962 RepID=A0A8C1VTP3_CYPCA